MSMVHGVPQNHTTVHCDEWCYETTIVKGITKEQVLNALRGTLWVFSEAENIHEQRYVHFICPKCLKRKYPPFEDFML